MPYVLPAVNRRRFLRSMSIGLGCIVVGPATASGNDPNRVALLADTHIPDSATISDRNCNMTERLRQVVREIASLEVKAACAVIDGDLAWKTGTAGEYSRLAAELQPLQVAGVPIHVTLGNHDARATFLAGVAAAQSTSKPVEGKHVVVVDLPRADLVLLDSLEPKHGSGGECGATQLRWLAMALDRNQDKPALVFVHHNPQFKQDPGASINLKDTPALWEVLRAHRRVKALIFGHTHEWKLEKKDDIHLINLPAVGYPFKDGNVTGWVDAKFNDRGIAMTIRALDPKHAQHLQSTELIWR